MPHCPTTAYWRPSHKREDMSTVLLRSHSDPLYLPICPRSHTARNRPDFPTPPPLHSTRPPERLSRRQQSNQKMDSRHVHFDHAPRARTRHPDPPEYTRHNVESAHDTGDCTRHKTFERIYPDNSSHLCTLYPHSPLSPFPLPISTPYEHQPTIYIVTFSNAQTPTPSARSHLLIAHLPHRDPPVPHLYTIDASNMTPPPSHICDAYSGISPVVQEYVMQDARARKAVRCAVEELLAFGERQKRERNVGRNEVALSVCCVAGTHRSVAIAERIAREVNVEVRKMEGGDRVKVVARHVHRVKGRKDPF